MIPLLNTVKSTVKLPSGLVLTVRPWLVGEEKGILMAMESKNSADGIAAVRNLIQSCILDSDVSISKISNLDLEFLFIELKKLSADPISRLGIRHQNPEIAKDCDHVEIVEINLNNVEMVGVLNNKIVIQDNASLIMRLPNLDDIEEVAKKKTVIERGFLLLERCTETIFVEDVAYHVKDMEKTEPGSLRKWIDNLNDSQIQKVFAFFENIPYMKYDLTYTCSKCGKEETIELRGLENFL